MFRNEENTVIINVLTSVEKRIKKNCPPMRLPYNLYFVSKNKISKCDVYDFHNTVLDDLEEDWLLEENMINDLRSILIYLRYKFKCKHLQIIGSFKHELRTHVFKYTKNGNYKHNGKFGFTSMKKAKAYQKTLK